MRMRALLGILGWALGISLTSGMAETLGLKPNMVIVSIDTLRADHLGCYGYFRDTSPRMDAMASKGVRFETVIAQASWTLPSHISLFTGLYPSTHTMGKEGHVLPESIPLVWQALRENGYHTEGVVSSPYVGSAYGFDRGMDDYLMIPDPLVDNSAKITTEAVRRLERLSKANTPFFLFIHYLGPHTPYDPPAPFDTMFDPDYKGTVDGSGETVDHYMPLDVPMPPRDLQHLIALYDGEIAHVDLFMGELASALARLGIERNTLFIILSDHGEEFKEHQGLDHGRTLYDEAIKVPLIMIHPQSIQSAKVISQQIQLIDIPLTLTEIAGISWNARLQGKSLVPFLRSAVPDDVLRSWPRYAFSEIEASPVRPATRQAIRDGQGMKLISSSAPKQGVECYDWTQDPSEAKNLWSVDPGQLPSQALALKEDLVRWSNRIQPDVERQVEARLSEDQVATLKSLGYLGGSKRSPAAGKTPTRPDGESPVEVGGMTWGPDNRLYVTEPANGLVLVKDKDLNLLWSVKIRGPEPGTFSHPCAVAVDPAGNIYTVDPVNNCVQATTAEGLPRSTWKDLKAPKGIAVNPQGDVIYVAESGSQSLSLFTSEGLVQGSWAIPTHLKSPAGLAVDRQGFIWVADPGTCKIVKISVGGTVETSWTVARWRSAGLGADPFLCVSPSGEVVVTAPSRNALLFFDGNGRLLGQIFGRTPDALTGPIAIAALGDGAFVVSQRGSQDLLSLGRQDFNSSIAR